MPAIWLPGGQSMEPADPDLVELIVPAGASLIDLISGTIGTHTAGTQPAQIATSHGPALRFASGSVVRMPRHVFPWDLDGPTTERAQTIVLLARVVANPTAWQDIARVYASAYGILGVRRAGTAGRYQAYAEAGGGSIGPIDVSGIADGSVISASLSAAPGRWAGQLNGTGNEGSHTRSWGNPTTLTEFGAGISFDLMLFARINRYIGLAEQNDMARDGWRGLFAPRRQVLYFGGAGPSTRTESASLAVAIMHARSATAGMDASLRKEQTRTAAIDSALAVFRTAVASADAAVLAERSQSAAIAAAVRQAFTISAAIDSAILQARSAAVSLDAWLKAGGQADAALSAAIRSAPAAAAAFDAWIQAGDVLLASLDAAILRTHSAGAALDAAISAQHTASASLSALLSRRLSTAASLDAFILAPGQTLATASLAAAIVEAREATAVLAAALQIAHAASAAVSAILAESHLATAGVDAWIQGRIAATAALDAALLQTRTAAAGLSAFIQTTDMLGNPDEIRRVCAHPRVVAVCGERRIVRG